MHCEMDTTPQQILLGRTLWSTSYPPDAEDESRIEQFRRRWIDANIQCAHSSLYISFDKKFHNQHCFRGVCFILPNLQRRRNGHLEHGTATDV